MRRTLSIVAALVALALAGPAGAAERYQPGVTDFPSYGPIAVPADTAGDGFDWTDAGLGTAAGVAVGALAGAGLLALRRRGEPAPA